MALVSSVSNGASTTYAIAGDFCRIFAQDMNRLYLLSFLLTADREKAEQCFVSGLEDSVKVNRVFREWARSWARRAVIQNAIRMIEPKPHGAGKTPPPTINAAATSENESAFAAILQLGGFERFVFVISVLENYSDQDCSILLGCSRRAVALARVRAAERIAMFSESAVPNAGRNPGEFAQERLLAQPA
jgi:hypothetical protein